MAHYSNNNFAIFSKKLLNKYNQAAFSDFKKLIVKNIFLKLNYLSPSFRRNIRVEKEFDLQYGIDTSGIVNVPDLDVKEEIRKHSVRYEPTRIWLFNNIIDQLQIAYENYVFVDLGSGKGRVLLLASKFPFKKIIGIETSPRLCKIARENIRKYKDEYKKCHDTNCICSDVRNFELINENTIFYLYNPFDEHVMRAVLSNIEDSLRRYPRTIFLVYTNPKYREVLEGAGFLHIIKKDKRYWIYANINLKL